MNQAIKTALLSVYHKENLGSLLATLAKHNVQLYATGGTAQHLLEEGYAVSLIENITDYPSILGGRVKTLHPKVFGGILARRDHAEDIAQLENYQIPVFDLVVVDLYPFEETTKQTEDEAEIIEKIDIGGISLIRAAAKNFAHTTIVADHSQYDTLCNWLNAQNGTITLQQRKYLATQAFAVSAHYDTTIFNYFHKNEDLSYLRLSANTVKNLRYGENPHQNAAYFGNLAEMFTQVHGKELSYNNLVDVDAAVQLLHDFDTSEAVVAIIKHTNPCGLAQRGELLAAWEAALAGDPVSAFGGVLIANTNIDVATAQAMDKLFFEVLIAPSFDETALAVLMQKKNRILLEQKNAAMPAQTYKSVLNGFLVQEKDTHTDAPVHLEWKTPRKADEAQTADLLFAMKIVKHLKSNAIALVKNQQLIGIGCGQTSRVAALQQAIAKAKEMGFVLEKAALASDAFFPFADCVAIAQAAGIDAVVQPGGSIRDQESIDYCTKNDMAMAFTNFRHFRH
ncbi:MAG: bifunctional phosphoribosylaminoimidazolecarboxamide formyltransferase/IMP cyclohydrolase [Chitinophagales bacterium]|nr:bifunctional phosphoribosylaminoimidazolecarboxamide formyltransferase/IMP cyclohydrolase [Bacteroidota bacterium]